MQLFQGSGRVALVTGAAGGIGRALVKVLRDGGAKVAAIDLGEQSLAAAFGRDDGVATIAADATREGDVKSAVAAAIDTFGRIDCAINLAGAVGVGRLAETTLADWQRLLDINLTSAFLLCREVYKPLRAGKGAAVLISSTNAINGGSHLSGAAYAVAKAGIINLTRYLAKEWAPDGIRINCVAPGPVDTPMLARLKPNQHTALRQAIPLGRYATAAECAATIAYLCSDHAGSTTGTVANISGGLVLD
ncbi:MAG: SDR family oxidoreductase [Alphaproteobacteria bacterium]|nr:SDR family oxidoreductase [Alphaproteobacteria bacterium]